MATVTVLYPNVSDATFDLEYYLKTHMPLAQKNFGPHGLKGYKVSRILGTPGSDKPPYSVQCVLEFGSKDQVDDALKNATGPVMADITNFSNQTPVFLIGEVVGSA
ncbi:ethyl tert-butyl ether degradation [Diplodia corticola]|uniref:Ethyl tert-butyl ether degradation n=1 Tax=Diplodia corticola TaxID=236234 RepID=A0A1J9RGL2_9PEZI|nr:ethyl tert-butyl ether degradation [Diplodia corticola]OJD31675.1 ethyl tert-butyl ether degradation [Diplodia corticola]